jgi:hypothetical protein
MNLLPLSLSFPSPISNKCITWLCGACRVPPSSLTCPIFLRASHHSRSSFDSSSDPARCLPLSDPTTTLTTFYVRPPAAPLWQPQTVTQDVGTTACDNGWLAVPPTPYCIAHTLRLAPPSSRSSLPLFSLTHHPPTPLPLSNLRSRLVAIMCHTQFSILIPTLF